MSLQSDHRALLFLASVAVLGAGVRVLRAAGRQGVPVVQPALDRQMQAADSASQAARGSRRKSSARAKRTKSTAPATPRRKSAAKSPGPFDRQGWVGSKLDLDVATAAQLDSLPGVTPTMAKRIVADRMMRGPFLNWNGLRRVPGVGPRFVAKIDSLIVFSGTFARPSVSDTIIPRARARRAPKSPQPPP